MKFWRFTLLGILLFSVAGLSANGATTAGGEGHTADAPALETKRPRDFHFLYTQYQNLFSEMPSLLSEWRHDSWSYLGAEYDYAKGEYRNLQKYNSFGLLDITTESVYKVPKSKWTFYGKFTYHNGRADSVSNNLEYSIGRYGSPLFLYQLKGGVWSLQSYQFSVAGANRISRKFSLGFSIDYVGDMAFRTIDTRNNQTSLVSEVLASANYHLSESNIISLGVGHERLKREPTFSNKFQHSSIDREYHRYLNAGLGTYIKNVDFRTIIVNEGFNAQVAWLNQNSKSSYSLLYRFKLGDEHYENRNITHIDEQHKVLRYFYNVHEARLSTLNRFGQRFLIGRGDFTYQSGTSKIWNDASSTYLQNYEGSLIEGDVNLTLYQPLSTIRRINAKVNFLDESKLDKSYGYTFDYTNLYGEVTGELLFRLKKCRVGFMAGVGYGKNLTFRHNPSAAAENQYRLWIADPLMAYLTSDFIEVPAYLRLDIPSGSSGGNLIEVLLTGSYQKPLKLNYMAGAQFSTQDNFNRIKLSFKYYF